ncbi:MAG: hypothetical protein WCC22_03275 [Terriglobales bacterium]
MKLKMLAVFTLVVFGCAFASAQTFGFASVGGGLYCNFEQLSNAGAGAWGGVDNLSACGSSVNATISGFNATVPAVGQPTGGAGVVYGDSIYAAYNGDAFAQWTVFTKLKCNKQNRFGQYTGAYGWNGLAAFSGFFAGGNHGFLSCSIPGKNGAVPTKGPSVRSKQ